MSAPPDYAGLADALTFGAGRPKTALLRAVVAALRHAAQRETELVAVMREAENVLLDYVPTLEKRGAMMGYGRSVLKQLRAALGLQGKGGK